MTDTLPQLDQPYPLPRDARADFDTAGFLRLRGVLDADTIARYQTEITDRVIELNTNHLPMSQRSTYDKAFLQVMNLWRHSELVRELVFSTRLARIAAELLGVPGVRLYHDQALYKEPGGGFTPWHADQFYWPLSSDRTCTVWIPLQDTSLDMGPLAFAHGSHHLAIGRDLAISDESEATMQTTLAEQGFPLSQQPYDLGDVSYHLGRTFHRAGPNHTRLPRRVMTIIYMDADITVTQPTNANQQTDLDTFLGATTPGTVPTTDLNPVLYRA